MLCSSRSAAPWLRLAASIAGLLAMTGCAQFSNTMSDGVTSLITPYRVEIVQGNVVTREQADQIKPGMSRTQVRDVLGSPMLADPFHAQRWDYVFTMRRQGTEPQQRTVVVEFDGDKVKALTAPELPTEREFVASISRAARSDKEPKLALTDEEKTALPVPTPKVSSTADLPKGAARTYPPLEPL